MRGRRQSEGLIVLKSLATKRRERLRRLEGGCGVTRGLFIYSSIYFISLYFAFKMRDGYSGLKEKRKIPIIYKQQHQ